jgi:hypothetical protein
MRKNILLVAIDEHDVRLFTYPHLLIPPPLFSPTMSLNPFSQQCHIHEKDLYVWPTSSKRIEYAMNEHCNKKEKSQISSFLLLLLLPSSSPKK